MNNDDDEATLTQTAPRRVDHGGDIVMRSGSYLKILVPTVSLLSLLLNAVLISHDSDGLQINTEKRQHLDSFRASSNGSNETKTSTTLASERKEPSLSPPLVPLSACLLVKDDNEILNEWIAYHYHVLDMRYLLVAVDPSSIEPPSSLFQNWERLTREMGDPLTVVEWTDADFMPKDFLEKGYHIPPQLISGDANQSKWHEGHEDEATVIADNLKINNHRFRQVTFVSACLRYMRSHNRTWTVHIDTDEYIVVNPFLRQQAMHFSSLNVPRDLLDASSAMKLLQDIHRNSSLRSKANYPCISMPRLLFGSVEDTEENGHNLEISALLGFNASKLETLRWKYHTAYHDKDRNAQPKVIIDVSQVRESDEMFKPKPFSIHRPSRALCRRLDQMDISAPGRFPLSVNHYLGSWERYYARNDTRRSERFYNFKAKVRDGKDDWIASWIDGFVKRLGPQQASRLLSGP